MPANNQHHVVAKKPKARSLRPTGAGRSASATALPARHVEVHVWDNYGQDNRPRKADGSYDHGSSRTRFKAAVFLNRKSAAPTYLEQCVSMVDFTSLDKWHRVRPNDRDDPMTEAWYQKWWTEVYEHDFTVMKTSLVGHLRPKNLTGRGGTNNKVCQSAVLLRDQETGLPTIAIIIDGSHQYAVSLEDTHPSNNKAPRWKGREIIG